MKKRMILVTVIVILLIEAIFVYRHFVLERIVDKKAANERLFTGKGCSLILRPDRELELSPLHGNVLVKCLPQKALLPVLRRQKGRLQTAGLLCPAQDRPALTQLGRSDPDRPAGQHVPHSLRGGTRRGIPPAAVRPDGGHPGAVPGPPHLTVDTN